MKKAIATTLAALLLAGVSVGAAVQPAAAIPYSMHPVYPIVVHHRHHHRHVVCVTHWRHHHKVKFCYWVPSHW